MASRIANLRAVSNINSNTPDQVYYSASLYNWPGYVPGSTDTYNFQHATMEIDDTVNQPFIQSAREFMVAVQQFRIPYQSLHLLSDLQLTYPLYAGLACSLAGQAHTNEFDPAGVVFAIEPFNFAPTVQSAGVVPFLVNELNFVLEAAFRALKIAAPAFVGTSPPFVTYDEVTSIFTLWAEKGVYFPNNQGVNSGAIVFSWNLSKIINYVTTVVDVVAYPAVPTLDQWRVVDVYNNNVNQQTNVVVTNPNTYPACTCLLTQSHTGGPTQLNLFRRLLIQAPSMLLAPSLDNSVGQQDTTITDQSIANSNRIPTNTLFEYTIPWPIQGYTAQDLVFNVMDNGAYQWHQLTGDIALQNVRLQFFGVDAGNNKYPLTLHATSAVSLTLLFRRRALGVA